MLGYRQEKIVLQQEARVSDGIMPKTPLVDIEEGLNQQSKSKTQLECL